MLTLSLATENMELEDQVEVEGRRRKKNRRAKNKKRKPFQIKQEEVNFYLTSPTNPLKLEESKSSKRGSDVRMGKTSKRRKHTLRPGYSPMAPSNYTQYLINDHYESSGDSPCTVPELIEQSYNDLSKQDHLSMYDSVNTDISDNLSHDSACCNRASATCSPFQMDIDYEYQPSDHSTTLSFMQQDFEDAFLGYKVTQLYSKNKDELISEIIELEHVLESKETKLKYSPELSCSQVSSVNLRQLVQELDQLRYSNVLLQEENKCLKKKSVSTLKL